MSKSRDRAIGNLLDVYEGMPNDEREEVPESLRAALDTLMRVVEFRATPTGSRAPADCSHGWIARGRCVFCGMALRAIIRAVAARVCRDNREILDRLARYDTSPPPEDTE